MSLAPEQIGAHVRSTGKRWPSRNEEMARTSSGEVKQIYYIYKMQNSYCINTFYAYVICTKSVSRSIKEENCGPLEQRLEVGRQVTAWTLTGHAVTLRFENLLAGETRAASGISRRCVDSGTGIFAGRPIQQDAST
ncbi:hypothetical protein [Burkholderia ubonensis]|uniref:hypothetical protein n=1 Tax=Burkholderia ubonensis TaxID=101571 RepID=UPI0012F770AE|nr:hypothetical protein [Burkholderia ubonensis]